jgi:hypothetical protein
MVASCRHSSLWMWLFLRYLEPLTLDHWPLGSRDKLYRAAHSRLSQTETDRDRGFILSLLQPLCPSHQSSSVKHSCCSGHSNKTHIFVCMCECVCEHVCVCVCVCVTITPHSLWWRNIKLSFRIILNGLVFRTHSRPGEVGDKNSSETLRTVGGEHFTVCLKEAKLR